MEFRRKKRLAASMGRSGSRQRKREAPECEEAETRWVADQYEMRGFG